MKNYLALLLAFATVFSLTACGSGGMPTEPTDTPKPSGGAEHQHSYTETVTAPTCTEKGYTTFTCACGDTYTENTGPMGHTVERNLCITCGAEFQYSEGLEFELREESYRLTGIGTCTDSVVYIPPEYNGLPVTYIVESAFYGCDQIEGIIIPNTVTYMSFRGSTFSWCTNLSSIVVESGNPVYYSVGNCIIYTEYKSLVEGCKTSVIPNDGSVTRISSYVFKNRTALKSITIPGSIISIGVCAFSGCKQLTEIYYNGTVAQWNAVEKEFLWDDDTGEYTIYCTDGEIKKSS